MVRRVDEPKAKSTLPGGTSVDGGERGQAGDGALRFAYAPYGAAEFSSVQSFALHRLRSVEQGAGSAEALRLDLVVRMRISR